MSTASCSNPAFHCPAQGIKHKRWFLDSLAEVHHTRFLLQPAALEVFVLDRSNALLSFPTHQVCLSGWSPAWVPG